jgi:hypothetical protein
MSTGVGLADFIIRDNGGGCARRFTYLVTEDNKHEFLYVERIYNEYMEILLSKPGSGLIYRDPDGTILERATFTLRLDVPDPENVMDVLEREYEFSESQQKGLHFEVIDFNRVDDNAKLIKIAMKAEHLINNPDQIKSHEDTFTKNAYYIVG